MNSLETNLRLIKQEKDEKILPENIKKDVSILGVTGTLESTTEINNQDKEITTNGTYTADEGYTGLGTVIVNVKFDSFDEYNTCNELAKNIFSQDVVWDIYNLPDLPNDGYDEYVVYNYDSTINLLKLADTALFIGHTANQSTGTIFYRANGKQYKLENSTWVEINLVTSYEPTNDMQFIYSSFDVSYDGYWTNVTGNPIYFNKNVIPEYKSELIARLNAILNDKNTNALPENIKLNKTILGVTGTYEPNYAELGTISPEEYTIAEDTANDILGKEVL